MIYDISYMQNTGGGHDEEVHSEIHPLSNKTRILQKLWLARNQNEGQSGS